MRRFETRLDPVQVETTTASKSRGQPLEISNRAAVEAAPEELPLQRKESNELSGSASAESVQGWKTRSQAETMQDNGTERFSVEQVSSNGSGLSSLHNRPRIQRALATAEELTGNSPYASEKTDAQAPQGRGAKTTTGKDLKTQIQWGAPIDGEGSSVTANPLGPDHPLGSPTKANTGIAPRVQSYNKAFEGTWKQGHLLNAKLGGPGDEARNLIAITTSTNSKMEELFEDTLRTNVNLESPDPQAQVRPAQWWFFELEVSEREALSGEATSELIEKSDYKVTKDWKSRVRKLTAKWGPLDDDGKQASTKIASIDTGELQTKENRGTEKARKATVPNSVGTDGTGKPTAETKLAPNELILDEIARITRKIDAIAKASKAADLKQQADKLVSENVALSAEVESLKEQATTNQMEIDSLKQDNIELKKHGEKLLKEKTQSERERDEALQKARDAEQRAKDAEEELRQLKAIFEAEAAKSGEFGAFKRKDRDSDGDQDKGPPVNKLRIDTG